MTPRIIVFRNALLLLCLLGSSLILSEQPARAQCPGTELTTGLQLPSKIIQSRRGNLFVAENGFAQPNGGRVSIVNQNGQRRDLLSGLPSGLNSEGDPAGTAGLYLNCNTLYIINSEGDATLPGPIPGTEIPNPNPSSPIISSILALRFNKHVETNTAGFALTLAQHQALKNGRKVKLSNGGNDRITLELVTDFPNYIPEPLPFFPANVRHTNPYGMIAEGEDNDNHHREVRHRDDDDDDDDKGCDAPERLYVVDGGLNALLKVNVRRGTSAIVTRFASIPNPLPFGPPFIEAVPTSIRLFDDRLLVTLFRGFPFPPGLANVTRVNPSSGNAQPFITGLSSAIDVLVIKSHRRTRFLTLELSADFLANNPGRLQSFSSPAGLGIVISNCLISPSSMTRNERTGTLYITEIFTGRIIKIPGV